LHRCIYYRLAAAHWPIAELFDRPLATFLGQPAVVDATDRSPSVLNGGLDKVSPVFWVTILLAASAVDLYQINKANYDSEYTSGNLGFDPLGLYPKDKEGQLKMMAKELRNGRLAMIAISAFAAQEWVSSSGVF
jgi:Chlorophyll A-B binding protein